MEVKIDNGKIFAPLKDKWLVMKPEEEVRQNFICKLVDEYGYSLGQMEQELNVTNSKRGTGQARADIVIWKSEKDRQDKKVAFIIIECKAENVTIKQEDYFQGCNYAYMTGADFFVTTNQKETRIFRVNKEILPKQLDEIVDIPHADEANNEKRLQELLTQTKDSFINDFTKSLIICHNIIRNYDNLSSDDALDEVVKFLYTVLSKNDTYRCNDALLNEKLNVCEKSYSMVLDELIKYNISSLPDAIRGVVFEKFISKTIRSTKFSSLIPVKTLISFMVNVLDPQKGERVCDPCCGVGDFLVEGLQYVKSNIDNIEDRGKAGACFVGIENNRTFASVSKMNMLMHGDTLSDISNKNGLESKCDNNFDIAITLPPFHFEKGQYIVDKYDTVRTLRFGETEVSYINCCLNLLKPGGRMGIIVPERFLFQNNLKAIREYFASIAKILLIVSLPTNALQNSGVKTSIIFLRKFTEEERENYEEVKYKATHRIGEDLSVAQGSKEDAINSIIKDVLNYEVPTAIVENIGIDRIGSECANDLLDLQSEFKRYRVENKLW